MLMLNAYIFSHIFTWMCVQSHAYQEGGLTTLASLKWSRVQGRNTIDIGLSDQNWVMTFSDMPPGMGNN